MTVKEDDSGQKSECITFLLCVEQSVPAGRLISEPSLRTSISLLLAEVSAAMSEAIPKFNEITGEIAQEIIAHMLLPSEDSQDSEETTDTERYSATLAIKVEPAAVAKDEGMSNLMSGIRHLAVVIQARIDKQPALAGLKAPAIKVTTPGI